MSRVPLLAWRSLAADLHVETGPGPTGKVLDPVLATGIDGWHPLHIAALEGRAARVAEWLDRGVPADLRSRHGCVGTTALFCAASAGFAPVVELLLRRGASAEARDDAGYTALLLASELGHLDVVRALLRRGANPRAEVGDTGAVALARRGGHGRVAALLRQQGATR